jgi:Uma2 family endonuclease
MQSSTASADPPDPGGVLVQHHVPGFSDRWLITEETVPEGAWHYAALELLRALLAYWVLRTERDAAVFRNLAIRVRKDDPRVGFDPDLALVAPAPPGAANLSSLRLWEPGHAAPTLVVEVVSPGHPNKDCTETPDQCAALGVRELVVFDPLLVGPKALGQAQRLHLWRRSDTGVFRRVDSGDGPFASEVLSAFLLVTDDGRSLRIADDAAGSRLWPTEAEDERAGREAERAAKEAERAGKEAERAAKEVERAGKEAERAAKEAARVETETERAAKEAARASAEAERLLRERAEARVRQLEAELAKRGG